MKRQQCRLVDSPISEREIYAGSFLAKLRVRGGLARGVYSATVAGSRWHPGCHSQSQHARRISPHAPGPQWKFKLPVPAGGVLLCVWVQVTASTSRFGGQVLALRVRGLCTFKSLVAGRAAVESSTSESRVVAGVLGFKFTAQSCQCPLLLSDQVRCGVPIVQHTACHTYSPGLCP